MGVSICLNWAFSSNLFKKKNFIFTMSAKKKETKEGEKVEEKEKKPEGLGLLEEDDEFEEFPADEWSDNEEDAEDVNVWEDNWDEDTVEDDFSKQLKTELEKASKSQDVEMKS